ncbi:MAG TPA: tRNA preQ1(34) S-adenosylmethionine ribosyltransferase-isomerase QueA [Longimicrobiales bacterium]|nr:tRNA preQ1(34) S-adenosylmethionine ribosyltransferase-isomerase QueA [Longimicrobiales bacterium]
MSRPDLGDASAYDYTLPSDLIAQHPAVDRDRSRLMVVHRDPPADGPFQHRRFRDLVDLVPGGDAVVLNETRVIPARLLGRKPTGAPAEVLLLRAVSEDEREWEALVRPGSKLKPGRVVDIEDGLRVHILDSIPGGGRLVRLESEDPPRAAIERAGAMPLPPYIERAAGAEDRERYQTVFARESGSVAAPTAGLHFTPAVLDALRAKGVEIVPLVLHVGVGTFRPVDADDLSRHRMHSEWYQVPTGSAETLNRVRAGGGSLWAVGTTVTRTLESVVREDGTIPAGSGWTDIFIRPPYQFRAVDRLVTNFHLPRSTLLMLVCAFAGYERAMAAYREAVERRYRFYSYGDAMVII